MSNATAALIIEDLSAGYLGRHIIDDLTIAPVQPGEIVAIVGPNGAGKSTLLKAIAGILPATGSVRFAQQEILRSSPAAHSQIVSYMPQALPAGTALRVLESVLSIQEAISTGTANKTERRRSAIQTLERLGIADLAFEPLDRLSGGQRQLASLAQVLARNPPILLLDEPASALDLRNQIEIMLAIRDAADDGKIVLMVEHDLSRAARWSDRLVMLNRGSLYLEGNPRDVITETSLATVYGVRARVNHSFDGRLNLDVTGTVKTAVTPDENSSPDVG